MTLRERQQAALAPVRAAMLRQATQDAERIVGQARQAAGDMTAAARRAAAAAVSDAEKQGLADAALAAMAERSKGRRAAQALMLAARRRAYDAVTGRIRTAIGGLRDDPALRDQLAAAARSIAASRIAAGPSGVTVSDHPDGGVIARADGVLVDCSLPALAELAVEALEPEIRALS